ncbi:tetratricopeptide repeat protein [Prochlorococcus sp. MIT 1011]|uniref:tetratricopeptide repeat protein n=1 Tax=Prochlorococcus sp. MIT 1011 TaxID=3082520 RepID=UPI0039B6A78B
MNSSSQEAEVKTKITKVKTFPVPFALGEIKENFTINTSTPSKPSKEEIIKQAFDFHSQGNTQKAAQYYQYFIAKGFNDYRVFSNYGIILIDHDKLQEAEICTRKAIKINPSFADGHLNLGSILSKLGKSEEAEICTRKAIKINPNYAEAYFNLGSILIDLGKLKEAEICTRKAIKINPDYAEAYSNLGSILIDLGKLKEAEICTRKAIKINPNYAKAYSNLGSILIDLGKLKEAEICTRKAIKINPDYAEAYFNLGSILIDLGKLKEAEICTRKAIKINPDYLDAHLNLGSILRNIGKSKESFVSYLRVIKINQTYPRIYSFITELLRDSDPSQLNKSNLKHILNLLLEKDNLSHKELFKAFNFLYRDKIINNLEILDSGHFKNKLIFNDKIFINALKKIIFSDQKLEEILTKLRKNICKQIIKNKKNICYSQLQFIIALGEQCFLNEYVYSLSKEEKVSLDCIIQRCQENELNEINLSILSCYFPLYKLLDQIPSLKSFYSSDQSFKELIKLQIIEPLKEIELSQNVKNIGSINDNTSLRVKTQYEESPYPRWRYGNHSECQKITFVQGVNNEINPNYITQTLGDDQLQILIAGCGTGQQILQAQRYKNAQITAIDLSLSSLAYAQRKINELEINNVELIHMDILEVDLLKIKFDIIECGGVLHHMHNPSKGLTTLMGVLKHNGFLKLGLYSELARQNIISARKYINHNKLKSNQDDIRDFRQTIFSGKRPELNSLLKSSDFYTLSSCRDLCFHTKEHRFTIKQILEILQSNELKFLGFLLQQPVKSLYKRYFPEDKKQINLQNWAKFEEKHPNTFSEMYQFWVCKNEN